METTHYIYSCHKLLLLSKLPLRDGNQEGGALQCPSNFTFETSSEGWKPPVKRDKRPQTQQLSKLPLRDGNFLRILFKAFLKFLSKLPLRDGNEFREVAQALGITAFETSSEGWKRRASASSPAASRTFETSSEGWKLDDPQDEEDARSASETSLEGWKHILIRFNLLFLRILPKLP